MESTGASIIRLITPCVCVDGHFHSALINRGNEEEEEKKKCVVATQSTGALFCGNVLQEKKKKRVDNECALLIAFLMFPVVGNTYISECDDVKCGLKEKKKFSTRTKETNRVWVICVQADTHSQKTRLYSPRERKRRFQTLMASFLFCVEKEETCCWSFTEIYSPGGFSFSPLLVSLYSSGLCSYSHHSNQFPTASRIFLAESPLSSPPLLGTWPHTDS